MDAGNVLQTMDLGVMLGSPFTAAQQAQTTMTSNTIEFLQKFAFERDASGNNTSEVRTFSMNTYFDTTDSSGNTIQKQRQLTIPLITMLNVPALQIQKMSVDLTLKINSQVATSSTNTKGFSVGASASVSGGVNAGIFNASASASVSTSVSSSNSNTNSMDASSSAKYAIRIEAENKPPAGLAILLDFCSKPDIAPNRSLYPNGRIL